MDAGYAFTGHTEYLAARTRAALPVMLLLNDQLRVALVTTHLALADVPRAITRERLRATLRIVNMDMERHFSLTHAENRSAGTQSARRRGRDIWAARKST